MLKTSENQKVIFHFFIMRKRQKLDPAKRRETSEHTRHSVENPEGQHLSDRNKSEVG